MQCYVTTLIFHRVSTIIQHDKLNTTAVVYTTSRRFFTGKFWCLCLEKRSRFFQKRVTSYVWAPVRWPVDVLLTHRRKLTWHLPINAHTCLLTRTLAMQTRTSLAISMSASGHTSRQWCPRYNGTCLLFRSMEVLSYDFQCNSVT